MNDTYKLQLRHGAESRNFSTRDEVIAYINGKLQYGGVSLLPYEPILFFYGADDAKNAIIMVGLPEGKTQEGKSYFLVDTADLKEQIESLDARYEEMLQALKDEDKKIWDAVEQESQDRIAADEAEANVRGEKDAELENAITDEAEARTNKDAELQEAIDFTKADLMSVIEACGLVYNEKLAEGRVSYTPDIHDEVIRDAENITEAIDKISKFATKLGQDIKLSVANTDTVNLTMESNSKDGGSTLTAEVNIAGTEGLSKKNYDNNIIGKTAEGLYASVSVEPSVSNPNILIFRTSGYIDGQFKVDAFETEVPLAVYKGDTGKNTGITVTVDTDKNIISGELNLASDETNILKLEDGEYIVEGTAKNIKYKNTNVLNALNSQSARLDEIEDSIALVKAVEINGSETDTVNTIVEKSIKGDFTVSSNVRLSNDKSIIISDGGLKANISATFKKGTSTLLISVGNNEYAVDLSDLAVSVLKKAEYDTETEELVLEFIVGDTTKIVRIPVGSLIHDIEVDDTDTIDMTLRSVSGGPNHISAELRVDNTHSDNILTVSSNGAYVSKAFITEAVDAESNERKAADEELKSKIDKVTELANANKEAIVSEASTARAAEKANALAIEQEIKDARAAEAANAKAIEDNAKAIEDNESAINNEVARASRAEQANTDAITAEAARAKAAEVKNAEAIANEINRASEKESDLLEKIGNNTLIINENKTAIAAEVERSTKADADLKSSVDANASAIDRETDRAKTAENELAAKVTTNTEEVASAKELATNVDKALETEITRAKAAEQVLTDAIAAEETRAGAAELELKNTITSNEKEIAANKKAISDEQLRATTAEASLNTSITEVSGKIDSTKELLTASIKEESNRAKEAERVINARIDGQSQEISTIKTNLSNSITEQNTQLQTVKSELTAEINKKANIVDVYTKEEILDKLSPYAKTSDVQPKLDEKLNVTDAQNIYATKEALQTVKNNYATNEKVDELNSQVTARLDKDEESIDKFNLTYNEATSELAYTDKNGTVHTYKLYSGSLIKKGEFDSASNSIVLTIENAGIESQITIPVSELLSDLSNKITANANNIQKINEAISKLAKDWEVKNSTSIELSKTTAGEKDTLTATVRVASSNKQAIQTTGEGLYVSNDLEDYTCVFGAEGTISAQNAISKLLEKSQSMENDFNNRITNNANEISQLKEQVKTNTTDIATLKTDAQTNKIEVSNLKTQVTNNTNNIEALERQFTTLDNKIDTLTTLINDLVDGDVRKLLAELEKIKKVTGYETYTNTKNMSVRLDEIEGNVDDNATEINTIENNMIGSKDNPVEGSIWYELNNIIDAGMF